MLKFIKEVVKHPKEVGAITEFSKECVNLAIKTINLSKAKVVVEFGCGLGNFTENILKKISPQTVFLTLEVNPSFVAETKRKCPRSNVYHDSAINIEKYLEKQGVEKCDCIISTLPWAVFDRNLQKEILNASYNCLNPGGEFIAVAYTLGTYFPAGRRFRELIKNKFKVVSKTKVVWKNFPPAFFYYCRKN